MNPSHSLRGRRPLEGVRVLDLTRLLPGPFASMALADLGASVDKLEDPAPGDYLRNMPPMVGDTGAAYATLNRDKRSARLDLKHPDGPAVLLRMVRSYDVVLDGFRPGVLDRLGAGHDAMLAENPRLVIVALTGYGQTGPLKHRAGHDINYLARAGVLGATGPAGAAPAISGAQMADIAGGGMWAVIGALVGLIERGRSGRGGVADIAMCEGSAVLAVWALAAALGDGRGLERGASGLDGGLAAYRTYATSDGRAVALGALEPKFWGAFCKGVGIEIDLGALMPGPHQPALHARLEALFASRTRDEWEAFARGCDCCLEPVLEPGELPADPHHAERGLFFSVGDARSVRTPLGGGPDESHRPARAAGADTRAVLADAGFTPDEVEGLFARSVVG